MERDEALESRLQQLFCCMEDLGRSNDRWIDLILSGEPDDEQRLRTHIEDSSLAIQLLEKKTTSLASIPGADSSQIKSKMERLREEHADMCQLYSRRDEWSRWLTLMKDEEKWLTERDDLVGVDLNSNFDSIKAYEERCKKLAEIGAELALHKNAISGIKEKLSTFPERITRTVADRVVLMSQKLGMFRKSVAHETKFMIGELQCLGFILKAFKIRQMIGEWLPTNFNEELDHAFNLQLDSLIAELNTLEQMKDEIAGEGHAYSELVVGTANKLRFQLVTLMANRFIEKFRAFTEFLRGFQKLATSTDNNKSEGCVTSKLEELVQSGEADIKSLELLIDYLETLKGQLAPKFREMIHDLKLAWGREKENIEKVEALRVSMRTMNEEAQGMIDWINVTRSTILNNPISKQEQLQDIDEILVEMDSHVEPLIKRVEVLRVNLEELWNAGDERNETCLIFGRLIRCWTELKVVVLRIKQDLTDNAERNQKLDNAVELSDSEPTTCVTVITDKIEELAIIVDHDDEKCASLDLPRETSSSTGSETTISSDVDLIYRNAEAEL